MLPQSFIADLEQTFGASFVRRDAASLERYGADALKRGHPPDVVVIPG